MPNRSGSTVSKACTFPLKARREQLNPSSGATNDGNNEHKGYEERFMKDQQETAVIKSGNNPKTTKRGFKPGQSGNPSGRPKKTPEEIDLVKACRSKGYDALMVLEKIMLHGSETNRLKAAMAILERGYGRPEQPVASASAGIVVMISEQDALI